MGGRGIMRRVNEFFRQDVKIRSNRSKEEYPPPRHLPCVKGDNGWERVGWWGHSCELQGVPRNIYFLKRIVKILQSLRQHWAATI